MSPLVCIILGRSGSGKGTQAELLQKKFGFEYIGSGKLLRTRVEEGDFTGRKLKEVMDRGYFVPTPVIFERWMAKLETLKSRESKLNGLIFDGSPRERIEARLIDEALDWYEWSERVVVLLVDISRKEAMRRLLARGRSDDTKEAINGRLDAYDAEVTSVVEHYEKQGLLLRINGEQSVEAVHEEILENLKKYL